MVYNGTLIFRNQDFQKLKKYSFQNWRGYFQTHGLIKLRQMMMEHVTKTINTLSKMLEVNGPAGGLDSFAKDISNAEKNQNCELGGHQKG